MILEACNYSKSALLNKTVLITGGGGGIGFEASRAFAYMGATVIIADIDADKGQRAQEKINGEHHSGEVVFYPIDISDEEQIDELCTSVLEKYTHLDVLINNAAVVPMGAVEAVPIADWDLSYSVNLRAPVLFSQKFISSMRKNGGIIVFVPSTPNPHMSAYEIFKSTQVELCNTLSEENAGTGLITYSIVPGFVKTDTAIKAVETVAASMGITSDDFFASYEEHIVDVEVAGTGYALSVVNAKQYDGKEIISSQVLIDSGVIDREKEQSEVMPELVDYDKLSSLFASISKIFFEQSQSWKKKKLFQRQFILSDFKKHMGMPADSFNNQLKDLQKQIDNQKWGAFLSSKKLFMRWQRYYEHQINLLQSYEKDIVQLNKDTEILKSWINILQELIDSM